MITLRDKEQKLVDEVLQNFNFGKCKLTMEYLNWTWGRTNGVPSIADLKESALNRIHDAIELIRERKNISHQHPATCSSGGLQATVFANKYGHIIHVSLEFVLTEWSSD